MSLQGNCDFYSVDLDDFYRNEQALNIIFEGVYLSKAKALRAYQFNLSCDRYSGSSNAGKRLIIDEPLSRQIRQKSSSIDMSEPSQNDRASDAEVYNNLLKELKDSKVDMQTFCVASALLKDPKDLIAYTCLQSIEEKVQFVQTTWKLRCDPMSVFKVSHCFVFCLFISYMIINSFIISHI